MDFLDENNTNNTTTNSNSRDVDLFSCFDPSPLLDMTETMCIDNDRLDIMSYNTDSTHSSNSVVLANKFTDLAPFPMDPFLDSFATETGPSVPRVQPTFENPLEGLKFIEPKKERWFEAFGQCEYMQFLLRGIWGFPTRLEGIHDMSPPTSGLETLRPLMDKFAQLEKANRHRTAGGNGSTQNAAPGWLSIAPPVLAIEDMLPPRPACDALLAAYIEAFENMLRILHVPSFMREYEQFWEATTSSATAPSIETHGPFVAKLWVAIALGSARVSLESITLTELAGWSLETVPLAEHAANWIAYATRWVTARMAEGHSHDMDTAHIICLLALAKHTQPQHPGAGGAAWLPWNNDLTRIGIQMGLHREPRSGEGPHLSIKDAEMRRRLWATMVELSLQLCFDQGLPAPLSPESYDCEPPSAANDHELDAATVGAALSHAASSKSLVVLAKTQRLRLRILQVVNAPGASKAYNDTFQLAAELEAAYNSGLAMLSPPGGPPISEFQVYMLNMFIRPFILALHGPFADRAADPAYYYSRRKRMEVAAQLLLTALPPGEHPTPVASTSSQESSNRSRASSSARSSRPSSTSNSHSAASSSISAITPSRPYMMTRIHGHGHFALVERQAALALSLDLIRDLEENLFPTLDLSTRSHLRSILRGTVRMFQRRMRANDGAHSVREFLLFATAEAYIGALISGGGRDKSTASVVVEAASAALKLCCDVMQRKERIDDGVGLLQRSQSETSDGGLAKSVPEGNRMEAASLNGMSLSSMDMVNAFLKGGALEAEAMSWWA
ncbi:fungal specific transcription factor domain-containing protein [Sarocladium implicatum]|nr:fungal specific transcription factor domain-containing protein [Sarocladium implicatum]